MNHDVIEFNKKLDRLADELLRFATVASTMDLLSNKRIKGTPLFSSVLFGEGTYALHKGNTYLHGIFELRKKAITNDLIVLGQEANNNGLWDEYQRILTNVLNRLKGTDKNMVLHALEKFIEIFRKELASVQSERTNHETISKSIQKYVLGL